MASGSGSNLQALIDQGAKGLAVVLSNVESCGAIERARRSSIPTMVVPCIGDRNRYTTDLCDAAEAHGSKALILAGFMKVLGPEAIARFPNRILNIHPSLLPSFPGVDAVGQALRAGVDTTGVTVHFVDEKIDHGPIVAQRSVPVLPGDDEESLHGRIQVAEHDLYPRIVKALVEGRLSVENRSVIWT